MPWFRFSLWIFYIFLWHAFLAAVSVLYCDVHFFVINCAIFILLIPMFLNVKKRKLVGNNSVMLILTFFVYTLDSAHSREHRD